MNPAYSTLHVQLVFSITLSTCQHPISKSSTQQQEGKSWTAAPQIEF